MEEQFNREAKEGWRFAADAARITDERASREDRKHTSGGVFVAADSNLGAVVGAEEGTVVSISSNEGRIAQARVNVRRGVRVFSVYFCHSEGWIRALLEAVAKQAHTTRHSWLVACNANMCPEDFERSLLFRRERMHVVAPKEASTCKSEGSKGEWIERTYDYVIVCNSLAQSGVLFWSKEKTEILECNEQKLPKVLLGFSGGRLPGRSEEEEEKDSRERQVRYEIAQEAVVTSRRRQACTKMSSRPHNGQSGKVSSKAGTARKLKTQKWMKRKTGKRRARWKCSGRETRSWRMSWNEEGWKEALCRRKSCNRYLSWVVHERIVSRRKSEGYKRKKKVKGWSTEEMKDKANSFLEQDTKISEHGDF